jgi:choline kinase
VVLAAGKGERLNGVSVGTQPKPEIIVSGISLAEHSIRTFVQAGVARFVFVVGFEGAAVETHIETVALEYDCSVSVVIADHWALGNGVSALAARRALVEDRFLLVMCDHLLRPAMVEALLERVPKPGTVILGVDRNPVFDADDLTKVRLSADRIIAIGKDLNRWDAGDTGFFHCTRALFDGLEAAQRDGGFSLSDGIRTLARNGRVFAQDLTGYDWIDIDTPEALAEAEKRQRAWEGDASGVLAQAVGGCAESFSHLPEGVQRDQGCNLVTQHRARLRRAAC